MSRATRFAFAIAAFGAALVACASPPRPLGDPTDWHEVRLPGLVAVGDVAPEVLHQLAGELALFRALVKKVTNARIEQESLPVHLYVFRNSDEAKLFTGWADGVMIPDLSGYFAVLGDVDRYYLTRHILLHEYAHYVIRSGRRHAYPRWYDEGLAEFLAATRFRDDCVIVGATLSFRLLTLELLGSMPLDELFGFDPVQHSGRDVPRFFATAWALVHYLNSSPEDGAYLREYVQHLVRGEDWRSAYEASFDRSLESLEASLAAHIANLQRGARLDYHLPLDSLAVPQNFVEIAVLPAEIAYQLGAVARLGVHPGRNRKYLATARRLFEQTIESDPTHDRARAALAWALAMEERWEESRAQLGQLEGAAASDSVVALEVARIATLRAELSGAGSAERDTARAALERAVRLGPEQPAVHEALGRFYASTGADPPLAIAAFERARELGAWSPRVDVELARQYLAVAERERAAALLRPVAADTHGGETAEEARKLLSEMGDSLARDR